MSARRLDLERGFFRSWLAQFRPSFVDYRISYSSRSTCADADVTPLGINELGEHAVLLLLRRNWELHPLVGHLRVPVLQVRNVESQLDFARRIPIGSGMERESGLAGSELTPFGRLKLQWESNGIPLEPDRAVHIGNKFDHMRELCGHSPPRVRAFVVPIITRSGALAGRSQAHLPPITSQIIWQGCWADFSLAAAGGWAYSSA